MSDNQSKVEEKQSVSSNDEKLSRDSLDNENAFDLPEVCYTPTYGHIPRTFFFFLFLLISIALSVVVIGIPLAVFFYFAFKSEVPRMQLSVSKNGIKCNKLKPDTISWKDISDIDFELTTNTLLLFIPIMTYAKLRITRSDGKKRRLTLYFATEEEARECCFTIQRYYYSCR